MVARAVDDGGKARQRVIFWIDMLAECFVIEANHVTVGLESPHINDRAVEGERVVIFFEHAQGPTAKGVCTDRIDPLLDQRREFRRSNIAVATSTPRSRSSAEATNWRISASG